MTGEVPLDMEGRGEFQDASQATLDDTAVMAPLTRLSKTVGERQEPQSLVPPCAHHHVGAAARAGAPLADARRAHRRMRDGLRKVGGFFAERAAAEPGAAEAALALLADPSGGNARIAILAGAGVEHDAAAARLKELAERWSLPVATTLRAKGVFPEDHELSLGVFGYGGTRHATSALLGGELDCLLVLGSGFNERDTMHWTLRERSQGAHDPVNTDMDELTANGDLGHVVPGSCHAFLDLMQERAAHLRPALQAGQARRREWLAKIKAGPRLYDIENSQPAGHADPSGHRDRGAAQGVPARRHRAGRFRRAPRLRRRTTGAPTRRAATSRPPISGRWAGRSRRRSACSARGPTGGSRSSPATAACRCTASRCRRRRATGCRSSIW